MKLKQVVVITFASAMILSWSPPAEALNRHATYGDRTVSHNLHLLGDRAYLEVSPNLLKTLDITDPDNLTLLGEWEGDMRSFESMVQVGDYVYVGAGDSTLRILDMTDPSDPVEIYNSDDEGYEVINSIDHMELAGDYLYQIGNDGLGVLDVSDPTSPVVGPTIDTVAYNDVFTWHSDHLFVINDERLLVYDVSSPLVPEEAGSLTFSEAATDGDRVHIEGDILYYSNKIFSIVSESSPSLLASLDYIQPSAVLPMGDVLYAFEGSELTTFDVSDPGNPSSLGSQELESGDIYYQAWSAFGHGSDIICRSSSAYLEGLFTLDASDAANPSLRDETFGTWAPIQSTQILGDTLFAELRGLGVEMIDISAPAWPTRIGPLRMEERYGVYQDFRVDESAFYLVTDTTVTSYDYSNPAELTELDQLHLELDYYSPNLTDLELLDGELIAAYDEKIAHIDVSDPQNLSVNATTDWGGDAIAGWFDHVVTVGDYDSTKHYDITAANYEPLDSADVSGEMVHYNDDVVAVGEDYGGVHILELDALDSLTHHASWDTTDLSVEAVHVVDDTLFLGAYDLGLFTLDISDRTAPVLMTEPDSGTSVDDISYQDGFLFTAESNGMGVYSFAEVSVEPEQGEEFPRTFALEPVHPNPFNPVTTVSYRLDAATEVALEVYNLAGRRVATLASGEHPAGHHTAVFDGSQRASGTYFIVLEAGDRIRARKAVLLK